MDHFMEEVVVKKNSTAQSLLHAFATVIMVVMGITAFLDLQALLMVGFNVADLILTIVCAGCCVLLFLFRDRIKTEYEYTFTNGDLDFAQVYNNKKRKTLGTMRVKNVEAFGPVDSEPFRRFINMNGIKRRNWFLNRGSNLYYFYYQKNSEKHIIIFEPSEELVQYIKKYLAFGVYQE